MNTIIKTLFLLFCSSLLSQAQNFTYFNKTYGGNDTINILAQAAVPIDSGYIVCGNYATPTIEAGLYAMKIDQQGNMLWFKGLEQTAAFQNLGIDWGGEVFRDGNCVILLYGKQQDINLSKLDFNGDTLWHKRYTKPGWQSLKQIIKTPDNGYLIAGMEQNLAADTVKAYSLKVDSLGNFEWDKNYIMGNDARFFTVQYTPWDGGYIFGGMGYSPTTGYDMFVVKTNSIGDSLWSRRYGSTGDDCSAMVVPLTTLAEYQAGMPIEYIMTGCYQSYTPDPLVGYVDYMYTAKLDSLGGIIWKRIAIDAQNFLLIQTLPIIKPDKKFIATGVYLTNSYEARPLIIKFNVDGTIAWEKEVTLDPTKSSYIKDMRPTPDGGYVLAGYQYSSPQTAWVLKIDSLGNTCSFVGCDSTIYTGYPIGLEEVLLDKVAFSIVPNPSSGTVSFVFPEAITTNCQLSIYDISGRLVNTFALKPDIQQLTVELHNLSSGIYYCHLSGNAKTEKLVIIK